MRLDRFRNVSFSRGASRSLELAWIIVSAVLVQSFVPGSSWRKGLLRAFGASVGVGVVIKPHIRVKFPWRLRIGDHCWIGESVWIDNLSQVTIGDHVCLSQGAYLCTGSHDWHVETFDLITKPIEVSDHVWIGAFARVAPGAVIGKGSVLCMGAVASGRIPDWTICRGDPARPVAARSRPT